MCLGNIFLSWCIVLKGVYSFRHCITIRHALGTQQGVFATAMLWFFAKFLLIGLLAQISTGGWAQNNSTKVVRYLVTDSAGGFADSLGRIAAAGLTEVLGQQVIAEDRTGAKGNIAVAFAAKALADGY